MEAIALHLLDRVRSSSDVAQYIRDVAFAYISENFLDKDLTLWAYIRVCRRCLIRLRTHPTSQAPIVIVGFRNKRRAAPASSQCV